MAGRARPGWPRSADFELLRLDREHFETCVRQYAPAALNLLSVAARRLRRSDEAIRRTVTRNVTGSMA
jgi:CRP-like cAMP-binding protein